MKVMGLFSGIGGFELGLRRAGFEIGSLCEIEEEAKSVLAKNFPESHIYSDVKKMANAKNCDIICGGFPCQDISIAGKNKGLKNGKKSSLWFEFLRAIEIRRPKYAIIENVSALRSRGLNIILQNLAQIGYDATYTMFDSKYFGVPQRRRRVYIIGVRDGIPTGADLFKFKERDSANRKHKQEILSINKSFEWDFTKSERESDRFAFFTRQRSDQFAETGLSNTLAKRDYKSFTDLVVVNGIIRRVTPTERLLLQGFPSDWFDGCNLKDSTKYRYNGMTVNVIEYIGNLIKKFEENYV